MLPYKAECPQLDGSSDPAHPFVNGGRKGVGILGVDGFSGTSGLLEKQAA